MNDTLKRREVKKSQRAIVLFIAMFLLLSSMIPISSAPAAKSAAVHTVFVNADGSFSPQMISIRDGDTVEWRFSHRTDTIIPISSITPPAICSAYQPFDASDPNEFTGPLPRAASGIYTLGPDGPGYVITTRGAPGATCDYLRAPDKVGNQYLCDTGAPYATMDWTWQNPNLTGVFIRLRWDEVNSAPGVFNWADMDREIEKAVRNGKLYSLAFKAGSKGTPQWIFDPAIAGANTVKRLTFQDSSDGEECGPVMELGSPADPNYRLHFFNLLRAAAPHIRQRNAWYRALAYVKLSGANLFTHEARLPKRCQPECRICNPQVWAEQGGYTPTALYDFYSQQAALLAAEFPDKDMSYQLIQDGFPLVNDRGQYKEPLTVPLPRGAEQTETILMGGAREQGLRFIVQHNGLQPRPQDRTPARPSCPNEGKHPAVPPFGEVGSGCPNRWVLQSGAAGQVTGFQTENASKNVSDPIELDSTFQNAWDNSDGIFLEIYEQRFWEAETAGPILNPRASGLTIGQWGNRFHERRRNFWVPRGLADPFPMTYRHTFKRTIGSTSNQVLYYINGSRCGTGGVASYGVIQILPNN
jgi:hypothetical protein